MPHINAHQAHYCFPSHTHTQSCCSVQTGQQQNNNSCPVSLRPVFSLVSHPATELGFKSHNAFGDSYTFFLTTVLIPHKSDHDVPKDQGVLYGFKHQMLLEHEYEIELKINNMFSLGNFCQGIPPHRRSLLGASGVSHTVHVLTASLFSSLQKVIIRQTKKHSMSC